MHMKTISATEFKAKCLQLLDIVQNTGEELVISKRGKPVARVIAEKPSKPWLSLRGKGKFTGDPFDPALDDNEIDALT
jgi:prevent-host-death family protein